MLLLTNFLWQSSLLYPLLSRDFFPQKAFPPSRVENARDLMSVLLRSDCFIEYTSSNRKRRRGDDDDNKIDFQITPEKQY